MKKSLLFVIVPLVTVLTLGTMNVIEKARWRDVTDGVTWRVDESGLRAIRVDPDSEAFLRAGIRTGDVLTAINKVPVKTKIDVLKGLWQAAATDQSVTYDINKEGMQIYPTFYPQRKAPNPIYYYLVLVGIMTLAIALIVYFNSRGVMSLPYVFFYLLALTFAGLMIFSPTGEMTALDTVFYGLDKLGFLAFPPLLLHFFMIFPLRKRFLKTHPSLRLALYAPAVLLLATRVRMHIPFPVPLSEAAAVRTQDALEHLELLHFAVFALVTLAILFDSIRRAPNILLKKQLRIIVSGLAFGVLPSTVFYVGPFLAGGRHGWAELAAVAPACSTPLFNPSRSAAVASPVHQLTKPLGTGSQPAARANLLLKMAIKQPRTIAACTGRIGWHFEIKIERQAEEESIISTKENKN